MENKLECRICLQQPVAGVMYGLQKGSGSIYETVEKIKADGKDCWFTFSIIIKETKTGEPDFGGPFVQGPKGSRFIYIDIGTSAGQQESTWSRRLKIPLSGLDKEKLDKARKGQGMETHIPGTGKDGGPNCGTVKPFPGWTIAARNKES